MGQQKKTDVMRSKKAKAAIELTGGATKHERIVKGAYNRWMKMLKAQAAFEEYIEKQVLEGIINEYNERVEGEDLQNISLYSQGRRLGTEPGDYRLIFERRSKRFMDSRADMAKQLVDAWLRDYETETDNIPDADLVYMLLKRIFFKKSGFKFTPELYDFLMLDEDKIHDPRLKKAQKLLKESIRHDRSQWYAYVQSYNEEEHKYEKVTLETESKEDDDA